MLSPLLALALAVPPPGVAVVRSLQAARRTGPIELDGRLDEPAWQAAELGQSFTQARPDEGKPASVATRFRVLWDDEYLYVGAECDDPEPPTANLSRRDRSIEGDYVSFDFDTTLDRRTAYHFQVYAAGQQLDGLHYDDTNLTTDWDAPWDSAVARTPRGWSFEARIPLRVLRIPDGAKAFGFNLYRFLSRRHEEDQWRFRPRGIAGDISQLGLLTGLAGIHPVRALELRPYLATRFTHTAPPPTGRAASPLLAGCSSTGVTPSGVAAACFGADLRYGLASDLSLVATVNPDFGQVEADQRVLNLSTFETFFPEKRPFFLEGLDLFQSPLRVGFGGPYGGDAYQIFYSRRIGRNVETPALPAGAQVVYEPASVTVATAAKLTGTIGSSTAVGLLTALEPRTNAQLLSADGRLTDFRTDEARSASVLRLRQPVGEHAIVGFLGTASDPLYADPALGLNSRHAHVGSADLSLFDGSRALNATLQATGSVLTRNTPEVLRDGTVLGGTASGTAFAAKGSYTAGSIVGFAVIDRLSPAFTTNDLGYMRRANQLRSLGYLQLRDVHGNGLWQQSFVGVGARDVRDASGSYRLYRDALAEAWVQLNSFWDFGEYVDLQAAAVDDRELGDGTLIERQGGYGWGAYLNTDPRKPVQLGFTIDANHTHPRPEHTLNLGTYVTLRPLPQLEATLETAANVAGGQFRMVREASSLPAAGSPPVALDKFVALGQTREYLLGDQHARSLSATLRTTWAFTPHLTLQGYAQLFAAGIAYGPLQRAILPAGRGTVRYADLVPAGAADLAGQLLDNPEDRNAALNVNLILRWEWRTGSTFYLVYAHQSTNDFIPARPGLDFHRELSALADPGAVHGDTFLVKLDVLTAL